MKLPLLPHPSCPLGVALKTGTFQVISCCRFGHETCATGVRVHEPESVHESHLLWASGLVSRGRYGAQKIGGKTRLK